MRVLDGARRRWVPSLVFAAGLAATGATVMYATRASNARERLRFENTVEEAQYSIDGRLDAYIALLRGAAGLFAASDDVRLSEFHAYVNRLELPVRYPGVQGIGFSLVVRAEGKADLAARLRAAGLPFRFWPDQSTPTVHAIIYLEPLDARNTHALGFDMWSEPVRREAMERARDTGAAAATARVRLVQEDVAPAQEQPGFLIYVPVYFGGGVPERVEQRRALLMGFVYSPFRADDLLRGILGGHLSPTAGVEVYDGEPGEDRLLHRSGATGSSAHIEARRTIEVAGRTWSLVMRTRAAGGDPLFRGILLLVVFGGLALSTLLFAITRTELRARDAAEQTARELRRSEEALRAANIAKDDFLAVVSHELRTPLNAILGWAVMLRRGLLSPDQQQHAIDVIERNAGAQARLVEDLLDVSRAVAGKLHLTIGEVDVTGTVRAALDALRPAADARGIRLAVEGSEDVGTISGDAARLQQVFWNLLSNAIKFTPHGGSVTVAAERRDSELAIRVMDTGVGIAPDFLPHVFERFRQADTSTTRSHGGVGLGLAIARALVELHGGTIEVDSAGQHAGTTFTVRLPRASQAGRPEAATFRL